MSPVPAAGIPLKPKAIQMETCKNLPKFQIATIFELMLNNPLQSISVRNFLDLTLKMWSEIKISKIIKIVPFSDGVLTYDFEKMINSGHYHYKRVCQMDSFDMNP